MPKRGNGRGSSQQRGERYVAVLTLGRDHHGKQQRKTARFDSYQQAEAWLKRQVAEPSQIPTGSTEGDLSTSITSESTSVQSYFETWLSVKQHQVREKTWIDYDRVVRLHINGSAIAPVVLGGLTPLHIERLILNLVTAGKSASLVLVVLRVLKLALGQAVEWGLLPFNPAARMKAPKRQRQDMQVWTPEQARTFLSHCDASSISLACTPCFTWR